MRDALAGPAAIDAGGQDGLEPVPVLLLPRPVVGEDPYGQAGYGSEVEGERGLARGVGSDTTSGRRVSCDSR